MDETSSISSLTLSLPSSRKSGKSIDSLAILPLINASDDPNTEYLSDEITETIINSLSQLENLRVMARSTVFRYKGKESDPKGVARDLNVRAVVTGRVLQIGTTLVIGIEMVDAADGSQLWGERYKRKLSDIFELQEEISREILEELRRRLSNGDAERLTKRHSDNSIAYQLYVMGRFYWNKVSEDGFRKSIVYFQQG